MSNELRRSLFSGRLEIRKEADGGIHRRVGDFYLRGWRGVYVALLDVAIVGLAF